MPHPLSFRLLATLLLTLPLVSSTTHPPSSAPPHAVIAYIFPQDQVLKAEDVSAGQVTRINYAFANVKKGRVVEGFSHDRENLATLVALKSKHPRLKILISVGGWTWSGGFSDAALHPESRRIFVDSALAFIRSHSLDGIDIDWEYPGLVGNGNKHRPEDQHNFTLLLALLRESLDRESKSLARPLLLSIAAGATDEYVNHTELSLLQHYVTTVNLMSYDFYVPSVDHTTGHHAPLYPNAADPKGSSASGSVEMFIRAGVPASKLVLGIPFYGHAWTHASDLHHGLFQSGKKSSLEPDYKTVVSLLSRGGFFRYWDDKAAAPYLYNPDTRTFVTYDDPQSVRLKCEFALRHHLAGVMFWEYSNDFHGQLLKTIDRTLNRSSRK